MTKFLKICAILVVTCGIAASCGVPYINIREEIDKGTHDSDKPKETTSAALAKSKNDIAAKILQGMTEEEKIYQLLFVTPESLTGVGTAIAAGETTKKALQKWPVGGIVYFAPNIKSREQTIEMIENSQLYSKTPLFIGVDEEGGLVSRISKNPLMGVTKFPDMKVIGQGGDSQEAYRVGLTLGREIKELGFNVNFAPVADVLINPENTEIGSRSFGSDPALVAEMVGQSVRGFEDGGVCAVLKHFPGHGSTYANSHKGYSESTRTLEEMRHSEFLPFAAGIEEGADFVMVSHMSAVMVEESKIASSLSKKVITSLLKEELGFEKIVITDSLAMKAVSAFYSAEESAVIAFEAGADMLLIPTDIERAYLGIAAALKSGIISPDRIDESVLKILKVKLARKIINPK